MDLNVIPLGFGDKGKAPSCGEGWKDPANFTKNNDLVKTRKPQMHGVLCGKHNNHIVIDYDIHKLEETSINLLTIELSDGTSQSGKPNVCSGSAGACEFGSESLWYYVDQCLAKGYPMGPIQVQASAGNSVVPAFALAFVSAAVAAFA